MFQSIDIMSGPFESEDCYSLTIVRHAGHIALGRKTRGYGAGQLVLPGGKNLYYLGQNGIGIMSGSHDAAREVTEEFGVDIRPKQVGVLHIDTEDDTKMISVFTAISMQPQLQPSSELTEPAWYPDDDLPYTEMPADYLLWLPHIVAGYAVTAFLESDYDTVVGGSIIRQQLEPLGRAEQIQV